MVFLRVKAVLVSLHSVRIYYSLAILTLAWAEKRVSMNFHMVFGSSFALENRLTPVIFCSGTWMFDFKVRFGVMPGVSRPAELFRAIVLFSKWTSISQLSVHRFCVCSGTGHVAERFVAVLLVCKWAGNFRFCMYFFDMAMRRTGALECSCTVCPFCPGRRISNVSMFGCDMLPRTLTRGKCRCTAIVLCKRARESFPRVYRVKVFLESSGEWECCCAANHSIQTSSTTVNLIEPRPYLARLVQFMPQPSSNYCPGPISGPLEGKGTLINHHRGRAPGTDPHPRTCASENISLHRAKTAA